MAVAHTGGQIATLCLLRLAMSKLLSVTVPSHVARTKSTDFPRLDMRGSRLVPRDCDIFETENLNESYIYAA